MKLKKKRIISILVFMMLVTTFLPVVANNLPIIIGSFHFYAVLFIFTILLFDAKIFFQRNIILTLSFGFFLVFLFPNTIWISADEWNLEAQRVELYEIIVALLIYYYFIKNGFYKDYGKFIYISLIFIAVTSIMTIYSSSIDPMYARNIIGAWGKKDELAAFYKLGGGGYGTAIAIMCLVPFYVFYYKNEDMLPFSKSTIFIFSLVSLFALFRMQIFGNLIVGLIFFILSINVGKRFKRSLFSIFLIVFIGLLIPKEIYAYLLITASQYFDSNSEIYYKLTDMASYILTGVQSTGTAERASRFPELIQAFLNSPIFGSFATSGNLYKPEGAHLYWMNRLAIWGIVGFAMFILVYYINIKKIISNNLNSTYNIFVVLSIASFITYGLIKNIAGREAYFMLFFVIPGMQYLPLLKKQKNEQ